MYKLGYINSCKVWTNYQRQQRLKFLLDRRVLTTATCKMIMKERKVWNCEDAQLELGGSCDSMEIWYVLNWIRGEKEELFPQAKCGILGAVHKWRHHFWGVSRPSPSCHHVIFPPFLSVNGERNWSATKQRTLGPWWIFYQHSRSFYV